MGLQHRERCAKLVPGIRNQLSFPCCRRVEVVDEVVQGDCMARDLVSCRKQIDPVLFAVRASAPDPANEQKALQSLLTTLRTA